MISLLSFVAVSIVSVAPFGAATVAAADMIGPGERLCFAVAGSPGDAAVVNLTPVEAQGSGNGLLVSSDVATAPIAANVNYRVGSVDPNVAVVPIGADGQVCYVNAKLTSIHLVADHLGTIAADAYESATASGAPRRTIDTRLGDAGGLIGPGGRACFAVEGDPGDAAIVNLTPVEAQGSGNGLLVSSDVATAPVAANVNYRIGSVDPNLAVARIGADGQVCFVNAPQTSVHLVADHLGTIAGASYTNATATGAPLRRVDTRGGTLIGPTARSCFAVAGSPSDVAVVNLTPVEAVGSGNGQLLSSDVATAPVAANVNYRIGSVDPNVAIAPIGADGEVCFVNAPQTDVHLVADHLGTIASDAFRKASGLGNAIRVLDTRLPDDPGASLLAQLVTARPNTTVVYNPDEWPLAVDADDNCRKTRAEVLIRDTAVPVTFSDVSQCIVATGSWTDPWSGVTNTDASMVEIDHTVGQANAHRSGGWAWTAAQKIAYANDLDDVRSLRVVDLVTDAAKGSRGPENWQPPLESTWCQYASDWAGIKVRWGLTVTEPERGALETMFATCPA